MQQCKIWDLVDAMNQANTMFVLSLFENGKPYSISSNENERIDDENSPTEWGNFDDIWKENNDDTI